MLPKSLIDGLVGDQPSESSQKIGRGRIATFNRLLRSVQDPDFEDPHLEEMAEKSRGGISPRVSNSSRSLSHKCPRIFVR